jgi:AbrB family looped-hinge helix DNA binding protein
MVPVRVDGPDDSSAGLASSSKMTLAARVQPGCRGCNEVGPKFQVTIPKNVREGGGLKVGDMVEAAMGRDGIVPSLLNLDGPGHAEREMNRAVVRERTRLREGVLVRRPHARQ